jgi:hypothetical protein
MSSILFVLMVLAISLYNSHGDRKYATVDNYTPYMIDDGLHYSAITPTMSEWKQTFRTNSDGILHMWLKCIDKTIRGYLFLEKLSDGVSQIAGRSSDKAKKSLTLRIDNEKLKIDSFEEGGGEFYTEYKSNASAVEITVDGWARFVSFPRYACKPANSNILTNQLPTIDSSAADPVWIMNGYIWEESGKSLDVNNIVKAIVKNIKYHKTHFPIRHYDLLIDDNKLQLFLQFPEIQELIHDKVLRFVFKGNHPLRWSGKSPKWQAVYQNLLLLQYWKFHARLFFWDPDEFLVFSSRSKQNVIDIVNKNTFSTILMNRVNIICTDCSATVPDVYYNFSTNHYIVVHKFEGKYKGKCIVNPNFAGVMYVHLTYNNLLPVLEIPESSSVLLHFANYYHKRMKSTSIDSSIQHLNKNKVPFFEECLVDYDKYHAT